MRLRRSLAVIAVLLVPSGACASLQERVDDVRDGAQQLTDRARFCLNVTRAATALESGDFATAAAAADEVVAQAPEEMREDARRLAAAAEQVRDGDRAALQDPAVQAAAERLRQDAQDLCDPRG